MKTLSLLLFLCFLQTTNATTYYFSTTSGKDSRTPAQAQNPATPWKTLSKLNSFFSGLLPGDAVLLKRGDKFYGSIIVNKSGTTGSPIVIGAYGTGDKPVITSLVKLSHWVSKGKGIWESYNLSLGETVNMVLLNNVEQEVGRYPNSDATDKGYLTYESHVGTTSITDKQFSSKLNWQGAELVLRTRRWVLDRNLIKSISGGKISYKASSPYSPYNNQGYFIQNDIKTLDKFGEWYYNPSNNKLSVYFGNKLPTSYNLQATTIKNLVYCDKVSNVIFQNLNIKGANDRGFYIKNGSNISLKNCNILFSGIDGVEVSYHNNFLIEDCTVSNSNNNGINLGLSGNNAIVRQNKITNTGVFAGLGKSGDGQGDAIISNGNGNLIEYNDILNTGYTGISFNGSDVIIKNNFINRFCVTKDDGAGIYSHIGGFKLPKRRKVIGNIIINGIGASSGSGTTGLAVEGIYMDKNASDVEIKDNTIANCGNNGTYFHNNQHIVFNNNTIFIVLNN